MSSTLSPLAIHQILSFTERDFRRNALALLARNVSPKWGHICELYSAGNVPRSLDGLRLPVLRLYLKDALDCDDVRFVFGHGKPIIFDEDIPPRLVSKVVEAFLLLREEPSALDISVNFPHARPPAKWRRWRCTSRGWIPIPREPALKGLAQVWQEVYESHLPCATCTTVERLGSPTPGSSQDQLLEKFHVSSKHFDTKLTVELQFALGAPDKHTDADSPVRPAKARKTEKTDIRQVRIYLDDEICGRVPGEVTRKSKTALLIPDFASDVYGFLDRVHIGTSLVASSGLSELIPKLKNRLAKHHLMCEFEGEKNKTGDAFTGSYQLILHHFRRDLAYTDMRVLKLPCLERPAADCALILHYLSNSHVADLKAPYSDGRFSLKMIAALVMDHNFTMDRLRMHAVDGQLTDYRSMDVVFGGGMHLNALNLATGGQSLANLIKTTDFLRLPTVQGVSSE
ncbi:hypothetical protein AAVH_28130, partial [Aphelenchoides avenae]